MKKIFTSVLLFCFCIAQTYGQNSKYQFANGVFKRKYRKQKYESFTGKVEKIGESRFRYRDKVLEIDAEYDFLLTIFSTGNFHPDIIAGTTTIKTLTKSQLDTMSTQTQIFYNLSRNDTIRIGAVQQLERLNPDSKTKRFVFWLYQNGMANPTKCYFELYNSSANNNMPFRDFVKGARVTFFYKGTIII